MTTQTHNATLDGLRWCSLEDALKWQDRLIKRAISVGYDPRKILLKISDTVNIYVPATHYTASIITRAVNGLRWPRDCGEWVGVYYSKLLGSLKFANEFHRAVVDVNMPINPDPATNKTEWARQEIDAILNEMSA